eukprot:2816612-Pleurochrysis_carterae.AAC.1
MMWVLRKKRDEKGEILEYKARAVVCGNQQKRKATAAGMEHTLARDGSHRPRDRSPSNCCVRWDAPPISE